MSLLDLLSPREREVLARGSGGRVVSAAAAGPWPGCGSTCW